MFERYTEAARRAVFFARYEAAANGDIDIEVEHLLLGILREDRGIVRKLIPEPDALRKQLRAKLPRIRSRVTPVDMPLSQPCKRVLNYAAEESEHLDDPSIRLGHLLLGILREESGAAGEVLGAAGITLEATREQMRALRQMRGCEPSARPIRPAPRAGDWVHLNETVYEVETADFTPEGDGGKLVLRLRKSP